VLKRVHARSTPSKYVYIAFNQDNNQQSNQASSRIGIAKKNQTARAAELCPPVLQPFRETRDIETMRKVRSVGCPSQYQACVLQIDNGGLTTACFAFHLTTKGGPRQGNCSSPRPVSSQEFVILFANGRRCYPDRYEPHDVDRQHRTFAWNPPALPDATERMPQERVVHVHPVQNPANTSDDRHGLAPFADTAHVCLVSPQVVFDGHDEKDWVQHEPCPGAEGCARESAVPCLVLILAAHPVLMVPVDLL
jgi:hypothetical protein